jgi:hypothetical protein
VITTHKAIVRNNLASAAQFDAGNSYSEIADFILSFPSSYVVESSTTFLHHLTLSIKKIEDGGHFERMLIVLFQEEKSLAFVDGKAVASKALIKTCTR